MIAARQRSLASVAIPSSLLGSNRQRWKKRQPKLDEFGNEIEEGNISEDAHETACVNTGNNKYRNYKY